jgi:hypothetical protein
VIRVVVSSNPGRTQTSREAKSPSILSRAVDKIGAAIRWSLIVSIIVSQSPARAEGETVGATRDAKMTWEGSGPERLLTDLSFRDIVDGEIRSKMSRGLPTTIVFTATLHRPGVQEVLATTAQTCRVTWHVWEEAYRLEILKPGEIHAPTWTTTIEGVLRRCAEVHRLLTATSDQVPAAGPFILKARVQVNPVSDEVLQKIKRWVSRPTGTSTAAPGDALFSTFTGLFLQRIGEAERILVFTTKSVRPQTTH